jgi:CheY-like chemotaxis protein
MARQGRILVVDDLETWRKQLVEILQNAGYYADAAASVSDSADFLKRHLYHAILLDVRLDQNDPTNNEGIDLLRELNKQGLTKAIKIIIISAFGTKEQTREAFKEFEVYDFFFKDNFDKEKFLKTVQQTFSNINLELDILWQQANGLRQAILNLEMNGTSINSNPTLLQRMSEEFEDLLCRLFYRAQKILISPLTQGHSGMGVMRVLPFYTGGSGHEVVIKFGNSHDIKKEYRNFKEHVQPFLGGGRNTTALDFRRTPYLGGIIYSLLGTVNDHLVDFGDFYWRSNEAEIKSALERLFRDTCGGWYANRGHQEPLDLAEEYQKLLQYAPAKLGQIVSEQLSVEGEQELLFRRLRSNRSFINPILAVADRPHIYPTYRCITHGDFNQHNLLVDNDGHVWMIDFQETDYSHFLRDIAMLDSVIRFQLLRSKEATLKECLRMEDALCSIERFSQVEQLENKLSTTNQALAKAYAIVVYLRTLASKLMYQNPNDNMSEYYIALLFHSLNTLRFSSLSILQREHALLSACLLANHLKLSNKKE